VTVIGVVHGSDRVQPEIAGVIDGNRLSAAACSADQGWRAGGCSPDAGNGLAAAEMIFSGAVTKLRLPSKMVSSVICFPQ